MHEIAQDEDEYMNAGAVGARKKNEIYRNVKRCKNMFDSAESCYLLTTGKTAGIELLFMFAIAAVPTSDLKLKNVFGFFLYICIGNDYFEHITHCLETFIILLRHFKLVMLQFFVTIICVILRRHV